MGIDEAAYVKALDGMIRIKELSCHDLDILRMFTVAYEGAKQSNKHPFKSSGEILKPYKITKCIICGGKVGHYTKDSGEWTDHDCRTQNTEEK